MTDENEDHLKHVLLPSIKDSADKQVLQHAAKAYKSANSSGRFTDAILKEFVAASSFRIRSVRSFATSRWFRLAAKQKAAGEALREFFEAAKGPARLSIIQSIGFSGVVVEPLERQLLTAGLTDKLPKIRQFAVVRIRQRKYHGLLLQIKHAAAVEKNVTTAASLANAIEMIEIGCNHTPPTGDDSRHHLTVDYDGGCVGVGVPDEVVETLGLKEIARRIRVRQEWAGTHSGRLPGEHWDPVPDLDHPETSIGPGRLLVDAKIAFENFRKSKKTSPAVLSAIEAAIRSGDEPTIDSAVKWLVLMAERSRAAALLAHTLYDQSSAYVRRSILSAHYIHPGLPKDIELNLLKKALVDEDSAVRQIAKIIVFARERRSLLPDLRRAHRREPDPKLAESMRHDIELMTVGYIAAPAPRKKFQMSIYDAGSNWQLTVPSNVVEEIGFDEIAHRLRVRYNWKGRRPKGNPWDPV